MAQEHSLLTDDWLLSKELDEEVRARAYDETPAHLRVLLKRGIQCTWQCVGTKPTWQSETTTDRRSGITHTVTHTPLDWTLLLVDNTVTAAARVAAVTILPRLAGVSSVLAISLETVPHKAAIVAAELAGIDGIFCLKKDELPRLLALCTRAGAGCLLILTKEMPPHLATQNIVLHEDRPPVLALVSPEAFAEETLRFMHGSLPSAASGDIDACFLSEALAKTSPPRAHLLLTPGFEGFWLYKNLSLASFTLRQHLFLSSIPISSEK